MQGKNINENSKMQNSVVSFRHVYKAEGKFHFQHIKLQSMTPMKGTLPTIF